MRSLSCYLALVLGVILCTPAYAELVTLDILHREPFAGGQSFGKVGPYDQITAIARFAIDPQDAHNRGIIDLDLAPRNKDGKVEFAADVVILTPRDPAKGNGAILYDVNNRGNKLALGMFNTAPGGSGPDSKNPAGSGFLMRRGFTVVWSGWIGELLPGNGRLLLQAPQARIDGRVNALKIHKSFDYKGLRHKRLGKSVSVTPLCERSCELGAFALGSTASWCAAWCATR